MQQLHDHYMLSYFLCPTMVVRWQHDSCAMVAWQWYYRCILHLIIYLTHLIAWKIQIILQKSYENCPKIVHCWVQQAMISVDHSSIFQHPTIYVVHVSNNGALYSDNFFQSFTLKLLSRVIVEGFLTCSKFIFSFAQKLEFRQKLCVSGVLAS